MSEITEFPGIKVVYKEPLPVVEESEGAVFTVNDTKDVSVSISHHLSAAWQLVDVPESIKEVAPLFIISRAHRGIMASNYTMTPEMFSQNNQVTPLEEVKRTWLEIANSDWQ